nr:hypothetical protein [Tanacetum cinerariifolium]
MRTRNSYFPNNSSVTILRRRNKRRAPTIVEPELHTIVEIAPMADNRTMEELLQAPTEGYGEAIVIPEINTDHFKIKTNLLQLVQVNPYHGFERENPHTHINNFKRITLTLKFRDVLNDTTHLKNEISLFTQRFEETFGEACERFKEMLRACPHHGFTELTQIDTFYNGLNENDQDFLNAAAGGNLKMNTNSRENVSKMDDKIDKLADQISTLVDIFAKKVVTPATVKLVEESCVTYGGNHAHYNCDAINSNQSSVCAATGTYNQVAPQNHASNHMAPLGFALVQNSTIRIYMGDSKRSRPVGLQLARENLQSRVKEEDSMIDVENKSEGQSLYVSRPSRLCAQAQSEDDMPFRKQAYSGPIESEVKHLLGSVIRAMLSPGGSIVASLENVNGFLAMYTPSDDLIRTDFEQKGVVPEVMLHILEEFVFLLGRHSRNNEIPHMVVCKVNKP